MPKLMSYLNQAGMQRICNQSRARYVPAFAAGGRQPARLVHCCWCRLPAAAAHLQSCTSEHSESTGSSRLSATVKPSCRCRQGVFGNVQRSTLTEHDRAFETAHNSTWQDQTSQAQRLPRGKREMLRTRRRRVSRGSLASLHLGIYASRHELVCKLVACRPEPDILENRSGSDTEF